MLYYYYEKAENEMQLYVVNIQSYIFKLTLHKCSYILVIEIPY